jgi:ATP phosphoribosyltransferase
MSDRLIFALPSKGRLMDQCCAALAAAGLTLARSAPARGYKSEIAELAGVEVNFASASEIPELLKAGRAHLGITGEDLVCETLERPEERLDILKRCGFARADVVVAVPTCWLDVTSMSDLEEMSIAFRRAHGRLIRVATKYMNLTRRFFAAKGVTGYRIVQSLGATEGAPGAGLADLVVDITTTGATLRSNGLKPLEDGLILRSEALLLSSKAAAWTQAARAAEAELKARLCA